MARAALRPDEIASFRARATSAAMRLFAERGYDAVTMRSLAAALGVSAMTPYRYIANKDELLAMVRTEAFRRFADSQQRAAEAAAGGDPIARLLALKRAYVQFAVDEPDAYRIMFELRQSPAQQHPPLEAESRRSFSYLLAAVRDAVAAGCFEGDPLTVAHLLWANTHGLVSLHLAGKLTLGRSLDDLAQVALELPALTRGRRRPGGRK